MPDLDTGADFVANTDALAEEVNARFDEIEAWANASIASKLSDLTTAARLVLGNASGVPTYTAMSGDVSINSSGVTQIQPGVVGDPELGDITITAPDIGVLPGAMVSRELTTQTVTNFENIAFDTEGYDTDNIYDPATPERLTCKTAGIYIVTGAIREGSSLTANEGISAGIILNDTDTLAENSYVHGGPTTFIGARANVSHIVKLAVGNFVVLEVNESKAGGGGVTINAEFGIQFIGGVT